MSKDKQKQYDATNRYKVKNYKRITLELKKDFFENIFLPYVKMQYPDISQVEFIRLCIQYCITNNIKL